MTAAAEDRDLLYRLGQIRRGVLLEHVAIEVSAIAWQEVRDDLRRQATQHLSAARIQGAQHAAQVRRELGIPSRLAEATRVKFNLQVDFREFAAAMENAARAMAGIERSLRRVEPTPIYDALVAERGAE